MFPIGRFVSIAATIIGSAFVAILTWHVGLFLVPALINFFTGAVPVTVAFAFPKAQLSALAIDFLILVGIATFSAKLLKSPPAVLLMSLLLGALTVISAVLFAICGITALTQTLTAAIEPSALAMSLSGTVIFGGCSAAFGYLLVQYRKWADD